MFLVGMFLVAVVLGMAALEAVRAGSESLFAMEAGDFGLDRPSVHRLYQVWRRGLFEFDEMVLQYEFLQLLDNLFECFVFEVHCNIGLEGQELFWQLVKH